MARGRQSLSIVTPHDDNENVYHMQGHGEPRSPKPVEASVHRLHLDLMSDPELYRQYQSSQREFFDFYAVGPLALIIYTAAFTRFNLENLLTENSLLVAASAFMIVNSCLFIPYVIMRMVSYYTPPEERNNYCKFWLQICHRGRIEDVVGILVQISCGLNLLGRVHAGQCDSNASVWAMQACNPVADMHSIPSDQVILLYVLPLGVQCVLRGVSIQALLACCTLSIFFVVLASVQVGGLLEAWTILYSFIFMIIVLTVERLMVVIFMNGQATIAADKLSNTRAIEMLEVSAENERKLKQKENSQLRCLMGNVAHDLKTPLHSIEADLDVLRLFMLRLQVSLPDSISSDLLKNEGGVSIDLHSIFNSLTATCKFMAMAINRSQDFVKASNNIALVPAMGTFEISSALAVSVTCMHHLQASRTIKLHPLDIGICPYIISDKHWLTENALCLLSNALKYSDDGVVDVSIRLIDVPLDKRSSPSPANRLTNLMRGGTDTKATADPSCSINIVSHYLDSARISIDERTGNVSSASTKSGSETKRMILITVEDTGIGIAREARKNLFQSFQQAQRMAGGTGLGLYSLSKRVEALGGSNGVTDRSDGKQGSMFWFTFPYRPDEAALDATTPEGASSSGERLSQPFIELPKRIRILLIDDSVTILKVTSRLLRMNGHTVQTAANGSLGLKILKDAFDMGQFDMVLTDLQMPVMDGIEATRRYRQFEAEEIVKYDTSYGDTTIKRTKMLIVGMSANSDSQSKQEALDSGMDYFIEKPFSYNDLCPILLNSQTRINSTKI